MGDSERRGRVRGSKVLQRPGQGPVRGPAGLGRQMRFATFELDGAPAAGVVADGALVHPLTAGITVLDLVRSGLPAALETGSAALSRPGPPLDRGRLPPPLQPPTIRDFA